MRKLQAVRVAALAVMICTGLQGVAAAESSRPGDSSEDSADAAQGLLLSAESRAYWAESQGDAWRVPVLLEELGDDIRRLRVTPEHAVAATAKRFALEPRQAAALVDAEVRTAAFLETRDSSAGDPLAVADQVEDAVKVLRKPIDRWRLLIRFYGALGTHRGEVPDVLQSRGADVVVEVLEAGLAEEVLEAVEQSGLLNDATFRRLLALAPGNPWLLSRLADSTWDRLDKAAIRLHLARRDETGTEEALRALLEAGAVESAVELWQSLPERPDLSSEGQAGLGDESTAESLVESMAAALWLEGVDDEAAELLASVSKIEVGEPPNRDDYGGGHQVFFYESRKWQQRNAQALRQELVNEGLQPSGLDPYEMAMRLLRIRDSESRGAVLQGALWPQAAARWAQTAGHAALERYFSVDSLGVLAHQATRDARGRVLDWPKALEEGAVSASLYELRETLYLETQRRREAAMARIEFLAGASAGYYPHPAAGRSLHEEIERVAAPFTVRQLSEVAAREWIALEDSSEVVARELLDADALPPTTPVGGEQIVDFGRDGGSWWVLHQGHGESPQAGSPWTTSAYWLSLSYDGGHSWSLPLHTGLLSGAPLELLTHSVEVAGGRLTLRARHHPWIGYGIRVSGQDPAVFELRVDLDELRRDEDGDGWNDAFERGMGTDPESDDSDGDGLADPDDLLPGHVGETSPDSAALAAALADLFETAGPEAERGGVRTARLFGPELPLAYVEGLRVVHLPEAAALDDRVGGRFEARVRIWMMNRAGTRAVLSWTGSSYGAMEYVKAPQGWIPYTGYRGSGCVAIRKIPTEEAKAAFEAL